MSFTTLRSLSLALATLHFVPACETCQSSFAILGGTNSNNQHLSSCETWAVGDGEHWELMAPNHESRTGFACAAVPGCIIVAGGYGRKSAEVFDEALDLWLRFPCDFPVDGDLYYMGSTLL